LREAAPEFAVATVTHRIQGYGGATPYVRWGNTVVLVLCLVLIAIAIGTQRYAARSAA
jgi:apolipoprotein N-acyltransferase